MWSWDANDKFSLAIGREDLPLRHGMKYQPYSKSDSPKAARAALIMTTQMMIPATNLINSDTSKPRPDNTNIKINFLHDFEGKDPTGPANRSRSINSGRSYLT